MVLIVTFVRHGESQDNPKGIWAGWKDAPLSKLGEKQAAALGKSTTLPNPSITAIHASPLLRARATGLAIAAAHPGVPFIENASLREHCFGDAEGHKWVNTIPPEFTSFDAACAAGVYPIPTTRAQKFPGADSESFEDLRVRARRAVREVVLPYFNREEDAHVVIASHGHCVTEMIGAMLELDPDAAPREDVWMYNTAWMRLEVTAKDPSVASIDPEHPPPLTVKETHTNQVDHLKDVKPHDDEEKAEEDQASDEARAFFGGGVAVR
ncbi:histidine phosphatase superfamily [Schizophyllum amplum]|uniref:Histidine phosphatase superfamily n=1 Tax=Schizophyllum amplum TaxID=97359 RepID=A0A550CG22_9AGAR|nr:histidine phosphatase superfamily [Auriculariopsis ampla]TRM63745.1 histidine phosphatase superfamily [Auriculariopsis ampla]